MSTVSCITWPIVQERIARMRRHCIVLRLALQRASIKDLTYEGAVIPKGTVVFLNAWGVQHG